MQLLQEVSQQELKETESDVEAATFFLSKMDRFRFDVPSVARAKLEEMKKMMSRMSLTGLPAVLQQGGGDGGPTVVTTADTGDPDHTPAKLSAVGNHIGPGPPSFALQLQQERLACRSVMSTSSDISAASTSSSEGSMACGHSSDGQRNPFSFTSRGRMSRKPPARPQNSKARKALSGPSVFSVKHPVVTAANTTVKQGSPTRGSDNPGFVFVPAKNVTALISQFKPIPRLQTSDPASDDALLNVLPPTSPMSGTHILPKPTLPKPAGAAADLALPSSRGTNTQHSNGQTSTSMKIPAKVGKMSTEQVRKPAATSLSVTSSSTMTSPKTTSSTNGARNTRLSELPQSEDQSIATDGAAAGAAEGAGAVAKLPAMGEDSVVSGTDTSTKHATGSVQKTDGQKLRSVFKICPSSAGDLRRPIISDFAVLPNGRLAVVDRQQPCESGGAC